MVGMIGRKARLKEEAEKRHAEALAQKESWLERNDLKLYKRHKNCHESFVSTVEQCDGSTFEDLACVI